MNDYLDAGVVRIQQWLSRTPQLRGRRGASTLVTTATSREHLRSSLAEISGLAELHEEAGDVDGVVSLRLHRCDQASVRKVERAVVEHLRRSLPAASLKTTHRRGPSYVEARNESSIFENEWPAAVSEWPPARPCQWCQVSPATTTDYDETSKQHLALCEDCMQRRGHAGYNTSNKHRPGPERELVRRAEREKAAMTLPDEFQSLSCMDGQQQTHIATVQADGNAIGAFIAKVRCKDPGAERTLPNAIHEATWGALLDAVVEITGSEKQLPVIPHLVGGDDVLLSVPAHRGWKFATNFQRRFTERLAAEVAEPLREAVPTASIGLVFHHRTVPFFVFTELSEALLGRAKHEHRGAKPAVAWQEITQDGADPVARPSILRADLEQYWPALQELAELPQSTRQRLATVLHDDEPARDKHIARMELEDTVDRFPADGPISLNDALKMVRWWQP